MWDTVERLWADTLARAERLPERLLHERVDDEWSFTETLRHLVFVADSWTGRMVLGDQSFHRLGPAADRLPRRGRALAGDRPRRAPVLRRGPASFSPTGRP